MKCRHCLASLDLQLIDLGSMPLSNAFNAEADQKETYYPLRVMVCTQCWLVQTDIDQFTLVHDQVFTHRYPYHSSTSASFVEHAWLLVQQITSEFGLGPDSLTIEVGSNDGYLLQWMRTPCYGIEPTDTAEIATKRKVITLPGFFNQRTAEARVFIGEQYAMSDRERGLPHRQPHVMHRGKADWMIANNVLAHVPDINDFVCGFKTLLKPTGLATFEFPWLVSLVQGSQFDTIYHEHYSYLSLTTVAHIFKACGLEVFHVEHLAIHGGSLRVYAQHPGTRPVRKSVSDTLAREALAGVMFPAFYHGLQGAAERIRDDFRAFLEASKGRVVGFGAAAKGNTLLNFAGIERDLLPYVVDDTPAKQGKFMPGSRIPVVAAFEEKTPEYVLILPWNFKAEIMAKIPRRVQFVTAIPHLEIVPSRWLEAA